MPRHAVAGLSGALAVAVLAACAESPMPTSNINPSLNAMAATVTDLVEPTTQALFDVELTADGAMRPGAPVIIRATIRGRARTSLAQIRITAPEVEAANQTSWGQAFRVPEQVALSPVSQTRAPVSVGQAFTQVATLTIPAPGYYRVVASAVALDAPNYLADGPVQPFAHRELWLWVLPTGGKVTDHFDSTLFPDSTLRQPGPLRSRRHGIPSAGTRGPGPAPAVVEPSVSFRVVYYDPTTYSYQILPDAYVNGTYSGRPFSTRTDMQGNFNVACSGPADYVFNVKTTSYRVAVGPDSVVLSNYQAYLPDCTSPRQLITAVDNESNIFANAVRTINASDALFNRTRPRIVMLTDPAGHVDYNAGLDRIRIGTASEWGDFGAVYVAHEYGHAFHDRALGGLAPDKFEGPSPPDTTICQQHGAPVYTNMGCALNEGFAEYYSALTQPDANSRAGFTNTMEANSALGMNPVPAGDPNDPDGSINEGGVAALLYDLTTGGVGQPWVTVHFPVSYVGDVLATCYYSNGAGNLLRTGIDHVINCLEQQTDTGIWHYFNYRSVHPVAQSVSAGTPPGWSQSAIRAVWRADLYKQY